MTVLGCSTPGLQQKQLLLVSARPLLAPTLAELLKVPSVRVAGAVVKSLWRAYDGRSCQKCLAHVRRAQLLKGLDMRTAGADVTRAWRACGGRSCLKDLACVCGRSR